MEQKQLKELKKGDFFTLKDYGEYPPYDRVYVRDEYDRSEKKYECHKYCDVCNWSLKKGTTKVFIGFTF